MIIYRFYPHGSKNIDHCTPLHVRHWYDSMTLPHAWHHDQECIPRDWKVLQAPFFIFQNKRYQRSSSVPYFKIRTMLPYHLCSNIILVHSEFNSDVINELSNQRYIPVHWFSHGLIARDWFRYAEHDPAIKQDKNLSQKRFLIYNRAWSGSREYRLKFASMLAETGLISCCETTFGFEDQGTHYTNHRFQNSQWSTDVKLENFFKANTTDSTASADYNSQDYQQQIIEVVLETIFDEQRISLTEKSLRPIATRSPFVLAAPPGSLAYLRRYGFETFAPWINESYDLETDSAIRLQMIINEMQRIAALDKNDFADLMQHCQCIADRNQQRFFSLEFSRCVVDEYQTGMNAAIEQCCQSMSDQEWRLVKHLHTADQQQSIDDYLRQRELTLQSRK